MTFDLESLHLDHGSHTDPEDGHCILEVVSMLAGQPFNDNPPCVCPVLRAYGIALNDRWDDDQRQKLLPYAPQLLNTAGDGQDEVRSYLALDWLIRVFTPTWLDLAGLTESATELRALRPVVDLAAAEAAQPAIKSAGADAAWDAAGDAGWAAAGAAAWAAARDAAGDAARTATRDAAGDAARDAARAAAGAAAGWAAAGAAAAAAAWAATRDAAGDAARDAARAAAAAAAWALQPTVELLQASALDLFDRMINPAATS